MTKTPRLTRSETRPSAVDESVIPRPRVFGDPGRFEIYCHGSPPTTYPEEVHETLQVCVPLENARYSVVRQSETGRRLVHQLGARDVLAVPVGQPHGVHWRHQADIVSLQLSETFLAESLDTADVGLTDCFTVRDPFISLAAGSLRDSLRTEGRPSAAFAEAIATVIAFRIGLHANKHRGVRAKEHAPAFTRRELDRIERFIDERLDETISVAMLARLMGLSLWHFMRRFNASYGVLPHGFITERRLLRARDMLSAGRLSIAEIALETGMSHSHFSRSFLRRFGLSPSEFRRQQTR